MAELSFQRETVEGIQFEILPLLQKHFEEVATHQDVQLNPDFELFLRADEIGMLRVYTARSGRELVGYACFFLKGHQHYKESLQATLDLLFIHPNFRGTGKKFIDFFETELSNEGAEVINLHVTSRFDYSSILKRMGYWPSETTYTKRVKRG
jgi:GNAT superfamily N-acetyltransferase